MPANTTHDRILEVATGIFADKGYNGTSMREIAEALGITKAALYYHFPGKEEIFEACITHNFEQNILSFEDMVNSEGSIWDNLEQLIMNMCDFSKDRPQKFRLLKQLTERNLQINLDMEKMHDLYKRQWDISQKLVKKGIKEGDMRNDIPVPIITSAIMGMIHHTVGPKIRQDAGITMNNKKLKDNLMKMIRGGFEKQ